MSTDWAWEEIGQLDGTTVGYGITRPGRPDPDGVPMLRAGDIIDGHILADKPMLIGRGVDHASPQTRLRRGDVVVVLVGRVGEAATVHAEHEGWNVARSVGIVRCRDPWLAEWLRVWLTAPTVRAWCAANASGSAQATLSLARLRRLPAPLPPHDVQARLLSAVAAIEDRSAINQRIATTSIALADAHFAVAAAGRADWPERKFGEVVRARTGTLARPTGSLSEGAGVAWIAPADVLRSPLPYLGLAAGRAGEAALSGHELCPPNTVLVAYKPGEVRVVVNQIPVVVGRGVLAAQPAGLTDALWLLHEIRSRSVELSALGQGTAAREVSPRAFLRAPVSWPPADVRERFARLAGTLHERALFADRENEVLRALLPELLRCHLPALDARLPVAAIDY